MIYVIIPVLNRWSFTKNCLDSLLRQTYKNYKLIVIDHGSTDGTREQLKINYPQITVLLGDETMWWTAAVNLGVKFAISNGADYVLTINNDLVVNSEYLEELLTLAKSHPQALIGSAAFDINNKDVLVYLGTKWNKFTAKYSTNISDYFSDNRSYIESDLLNGRGTLFPINVFNEIGYFDEKHFPHYAADEDFSYNCYKVGYSLLVSKNAKIYSIVEATGLEELILKGEYLNFIFKYFTSRRSPANLKYRWFWALKNSSIPFVYFIFDFARLFFGLMKKLFI